MKRFISFIALITIIVSACTPNVNETPLQPSQAVVTNTLPNPQINTTR
ncbi:MAG: hypothetical protein HGB14_01445, partial [Anaerolineaceae bacterium]|nr:hypothetical protein [Anaerolineaceae bacterium]